VRPRGAGQPGEGEKEPGVPTGLRTMSRVLLKQIRSGSWAAHPGTKINLG
jgi:hypothetical protein